MAAGTLKPGGVGITEIILDIIMDTRHAVMQKNMSEVMERICGAVMDSWTSHRKKTVVVVNNINGDVKPGPALESISLAVIGNILAPGRKKITCPT